MSETPVASIRAIDPSLMLQTVQPMVPVERAFLRDLTAQVFQVQSDSAPMFSEAPTAVHQAYVAADGASYFVPTVEVARRSRVTDTPWVFIDRGDQGHVLTLQLVVRRHPAISADAQPLPVAGWAATLEGNGQRIELECLELPVVDPDEGGAPDDGVITRLSCQGVVDANVVTSILQDDPRAVFAVSGDVAYRHAIPGNTGIAGPRIDWKAIQAIQLQPVAEAVVEPVAEPAAPTRMRLRALRDLRRADLTISGQVAAVDRPSAPPSWAQGESKTVRVELGRPGAHFPVAVAANRSIYSRVGGSLGTNPAAAWVHTAFGDFVESPVPNQFYVLPDQYRLAFDVETSTPAMAVLLIPGESDTQGEGTATFSGSYGLRVRFSIVPWLDGQRISDLRTAISEQTGIPYPELVIGGTAAATFGLSEVFSNLGARLVGATDGQPPAVDPRGFELVLDCTSEFYTLLARLVVTDGLTGLVQLALSGTEGEVTTTVSVPTNLRLDRPDTSFLTTRLEAIDDDPTTPLQVTVVNPAAVGARVGLVRSTLLVVDAEVPAPLKAGPGTSTPASCDLAPAADGTPQEQRLDIVGDGEEVLWGGVAVSLEQVTLDLDPDQVLARAQELGSATGLRSSVHLVCYQLQHPDVLPPELSGLIGLQVELRRAETAEPVTVYLTKDTPATDVDVAFTLAEVLAGASPEQPKFSWRRRNMLGAGSGEWSEWETIIGRELFVTPVVATAGSPS